MNFRPRVAREIIILARAACCTRTRTVHNIHVRTLATPGSHERETLLSPDSVVVFCKYLDMMLHSLASHPYFSSCACAGERGRGKGRKNTSDKKCKVLVTSAGMLAEPIKFEHPK